MAKRREKALKLKQKLSETVEQNDEVAHEPNLMGE